MTPKQERFVAEYLESSRVDACEYEFCEPSGYYTYLLVDPRDSSIFYVGKGKGWRMRQHGLDVERGRIDNAAKHRRIAEIHADGLEVDCRVVACFQDEGEALALEMVLIVALREGLTNISGGNRTANDIAKEQARYYLSRMKSLDEWWASATAEQWHAAEVMGGPHHCYNSAVRWLTEAAES